MDARSTMILMALIEAQPIPESIWSHSRIADLIIGITRQLIESLKLDLCKFSIPCLDPKRNHDITVVGPFIGFAHRTFRESNLTRLPDCIELQADDVTESKTQRNFQNH